jgi:hypothetical protein
MRAAPICSRLWVISNGLHQYHTYLFEKMEKYLLHFRYSATPGWGAPRFRQLPRWIRLQATRSLSDCEMAQSRCISQRSPPSAILYIRPNTTLVIKNCFGRWWLEWCRNITILKIIVGIILDVGLGNHLNSDFKIRWPSDSNTLTRTGLISAGSSTFSQNTQILQQSVPSPNRQGPDRSFQSIQTSVQNYLTTYRCRTWYTPILVSDRGENKMYERLSLVWKGYRGRA